MAPSRSSSRRHERHSRRDERRHIARRRCVRYKKLKYRGGQRCGSSHGDECREVGSCVVRIRCVCRVTGEAGVGRGIVEEGKGCCWAVSRHGGIRSCGVSKGRDRECEGYVLREASRDGSDDCGFRTGREVEHCNGQSLTQTLQRSI
jgi:hypothetical protein